MKKAVTLRPLDEMPRMSDPATLEPFTDSAQTVLARFELEDEAFHALILKAQKISEGQPGWTTSIETILAGLFQRGVPRDQVRACLLSWWMTGHKGREWIDETVNEAKKAGKPTNQRTPPAVAEDGFLRTKEGRAVSNSFNLRHALAQLRVKLHFDELRGQHRLEQADDGRPHSLDDRQMRRLKLAMEERFELRFSKAYFEDSLLTIAEEDNRHPVREYLSGLTGMWDDVPRIDRWLTKYLGVEESQYTNEVGLRVLIGAVARAMQPGCKFDQMLVLEGAQGVGKSTALAALVPDPEWFTDTVPMGDSDQRLMEAIAGKWIVEASELGGMSRGEVEQLKATLSRPADRARMAYAKSVSERPRQCILIGTTNESVYLRDQSGNRRFWPVTVGEIDLQKLKADREQLWAEAFHRYKAGEPWTMNREVWATAATEQEGRSVVDPILEKLESALGHYSDAKIRSCDIWPLIGLGAGKPTQDENRRLGQAMATLGWKRDKMRFGELQTARGYKTGSGELRLAVTRPASGESSVYADVGS